MSVFVDTGAWFAYFVRRDSDHNSARSWVSTNESPLVTSDYILDELFTLLKIRESHVVAVAAGKVLIEERKLSKGINEALAKEFIQFTEGLIEWLCQKMK